MQKLLLFAHVFISKTLNFKNNISRRRDKFALGGGKIIIIQDIRTYCTFNIELVAYKLGLDNFHLFFFKHMFVIL